MRALATLLALSLTLPAAAQDRFALVVGQNDGGEGRAMLRYAERDAERFAEVLARLGGVGAAQLDLVLGPDAPRFEAALQALAARAAEAQAAGRRVEVVVYYSGHADEEGLLLEGGRVGFQALRQALTELPADVRVAVVDACAAGALTRAKGGVHVSPFLVDESSEMKGHAFLTAASETEAAQESDKLQGSFFTHALTTGMRGAADVSGDGQVTLDEAYRYAFDETLARTERSRIGPQHPGFDIQLTGQGELVITDVREASATLVLAPPLEGQLFIRDGAGRLALEVRKAPGRAVQLGLEPGDYAVTLARGEERLEASVRLASAGVVALEPERFRAAEVDAQVVARGDEPADEPTGEPAVRDSGKAPFRPDFVPFNVSLFPGISINDIAWGGPQVNHFAFDLLVGNTLRLDGVSFGFGLGWVWEDVNGIQTSIAGTVAGGEVHGFQVSVGANVAVGEVRGMQITSGLNVAVDTVRGLQLGSGVNYAGRTVGAQIALVNVGGLVQGAQIGLLNLARRVEGAQVGLVNLSIENEGAAIGLLGGAWRGYNHLAVYASDLAPVNVSAQLGSRYVYTILSGGYQPATTFGLTDGAYFVASLGLGGHIPLTETFFLDLDVSGGSAIPDDFDVIAGGNHVLVVSRAMVGWQPDRFFGVFGGISSNAIFGFDRPVSAIGLGSQLGEGQGDLAVWPGAFLGVRL